MLLLLASQDAFLHGVAEKLLIYATGSPVRFCDRAELNQIVARTAQAGSGLRTLIHEIVRSQVFQTK